MKLSDLALRIAALKTLADDVSDAIAGAKTALEKAMQDAGADRTAAKLPDGTKVASLPLAGGEAKARVTDPAALLAWVQKVHPEEVIQSVNPEYVKKLLAAADANGAAVDSGGEVVPGIEFKPTTPYVSVNFTRGVTPGRTGRGLIREAWHTGQLEVRDLLALPAGESDE